MYYFSKLAPLRGAKGRWDHMGLDGIILFRSGFGKQRACREKALPRVWVTPLAPYASTSRLSADRKGGQIKTRENKNLFPLVKSCVNDMDLFEAELHDPEP